MKIIAHVYLTITDKACICILSFKSIICFIILILYMRKVKLRKVR